MTRISRLALVLLLSTVACGDPWDYSNVIDFSGVGRDLPRSDASGVDVDLGETPTADLDVARDLTSQPVDLAGGIDAGTLVPVSHPRELRAVWVGSVFRLDFPSSINLTPTQARAELSSIVNTVEGAKGNAILFQVRPESDALYSSSLEPWSRFLTGTQGGDPGYDPLALLIELAHAKGIEVHAWFNPYRARATMGTFTAPTHVTNRFPSAVIAYGSADTMDPSNSAVRDFVVSVITDVVHRYDVDGVIFDDYFYPYPAGSSYPDDASYNAYLAGGGTLGKSDWRRDNVNGLVQRVGNAVRTEKPWVRWGVAPFGIYRPGIPAGVTGIDSYEALACDSPRWISEGWIDYIAPQIYWTTTSTGQPYGALIDWWSSNSVNNRPIFPSLALYKLGTSSEWTVNEMVQQVTLARAQAPRSSGQTWFRYQWLRDNTNNARDVFTRSYTTPARPPAVPGVASATVSAPFVAVNGTTIMLGHGAVATIRGYAVYQDTGGRFSFVRWVPSATSTVTLSSGRFAISAIDRGGVESLGVPFTIP